jgi:hypothetical protein
MSNERIESITSSIAQQLEDEYAEAAQTNREEKIKNLRQLAAQGREILTVHENAKSTIIESWIFSFFSIPVGVFMLLSSVKGGGGLWGFLILIIGLGSVAFGWMYWHRRKIPFMKLTEEGLWYVDLAQPIPWVAIKNYRVELGHKRGYFMIYVYISENYKILLNKNVQSAWHGGRRVWCNVRTNVIVFKAPGLREMSSPDLLKAFSTYWHAGLARAELIRMGEAK